jgi:Zn-dependent protease
MVIRYKPLIRGMMLGLVLFVSLYGNIVLHELGHFIVAKYFDLQPKMYFFDNGSGTGFSFFNQHFYTTYSPIANSSKDFFIALAGPLVNLILTIVLAIIYVKIPKTKQNLKLAILMLLIPAIISFVSNILPLAGTDGAIIWSHR